MRTQNSLSILGVLSSVTLIASACRNQLTDPGPGNRVQAKLEQQAYYSGDTVIVQVRNISSVSLVFPAGFCRTDLQRFDRAGGTWTAAAVNPAEGCAFVLANLGPGRAVVMRYPLSKSIDSGLYRLAMPMPVPRDANAPEAALLSPSFEVNPVALF